MESPLSQEAIHMPVEDNRLDRTGHMCSARSGQLGQSRSALLGLTMCDLQLRKVRTSSSELRFG